MGVQVTVTQERKSMEPWLLDAVVFKDHQISGIRKLMRWRSFLLADDMGLGKSLQALTVFIGDIIMGNGDTAIVICPTTLRGNWADEIEKFTRVPYVRLGEEYIGDTERVKTLGPKARSAQLADFSLIEGPKILITNYEQIGPHLEELNRIGFHAAIFDEATYMKNPSSQRTKACLALKAKRNFILTGTPILNQVSELWALLNKISPQTFPNYYKFINRYCVFGGYQNKQVVGAKNITELNKVLEQVMLRRLKKDVLTIPEPTYIQVKVDLSPLQQKLYDEADDELRISSIDPLAPAQEIDNALVKFLRLKQICGTPATLGFDDVSFKLDAVIDRLKIDIANGEKVVIFTQFRGVLDAIRNRIDKEGISRTELTGDVKKPDRMPLVRAWADTPGPTVLLCMTQLAIGFNATEAKVCYFVDKLFVPGLNQQAVDRLHRIGQQETQAIQVVEFIARGTVESRVEAILRTKKKTFDNVIESVGFMRKLLEALNAKEESE